MSDNLRIRRSRKDMVSARTKSQVADYVPGWICVFFLVIAASSSWPYFFYTLLRILVALSSVFLCYKSHVEKRVTWTWVFGGVALLFNPLIPMRMARADWETVNLIAAAIFFCHILSSFIARYRANKPEVPISSLQSPMPNLPAPNQRQILPPIEDSALNLAKVEAQYCVLRGRNYYDLASSEDYDPAKAAACFERGLQADPMNSECHVWLGMIALDGDGVSKDNAKAFGHFSIGAALGDSNAQRSLAEMYECGDGISMDLSKALSWYIKAAEQGDTYSQYKSGAFCLSGTGTTFNPERAYYWLSRAAESNEEDAQLLLAKMYQEGTFVDRDKQQSAYWRDRAAEMCARRS